MDELEKVSVDTGEARVLRITEIGGDRQALLVEMARGDGYVTILLLGQGPDGDDASLAVRKTDLVALAKKLSWIGVEW